MIEQILQDVEVIKVGNKFEIKYFWCFYNKDLSDFLAKTEVQIVHALIAAGVLSGQSEYKCCVFLLVNIKFDSVRHPFLSVTTKSCKSNRVSIYNNTIFHLKKLSISNVLEILCSFSCRRTVADCSETFYVSKTTIMSFYSLFRSNICIFLEKFSLKLGGPGVVVHF
jgi:hypothetical protein